jgi:hypothetical protein
MVWWWIGRELEGSDCGPAEVLSRHLPLVSEENHEETMPEYPMSGRLFEGTTQNRSSFSVNALGEGVWNRLYRYLTLGREREMSAWLDETEQRNVIQWGANTWFRKWRDHEEFSVTADPYSVVAKTLSSCLALHTGLQHFFSPSSSPHGLEKCTLINTFSSTARSLPTGWKSTLLFHPVTISPCTHTLMLDLYIMPSTPPPSQGDICKICRSVGKSLNAPCSLLLRDKFIHEAATLRTYEQEMFLCVIYECWVAQPLTTVHAMKVIPT